MPETRARARHPPRAHPLRRSVAASRLGLRRRVSRHDPDRDRHDRARAAQGAAAGERPRDERRDGRARVPRRAAVAVRQGERPRDRQRALDDEEARMAEIALSNVSKRFGADARRSIASTCRWRTASSWCCSARPAPARRRRSGSSPGLERPDAGHDPHRRPRRHAGRAGGARRDLRLPAIFALSAPFGVTTTSPSRSARRRAAWPRAEIKKRIEQVAETLRIAASCRTARRSFPAARCSASRSAARSCAGPPSI